MGTTFLGENFHLSTEVAVRLYHEYAAPQPIYDYHCHLSPRGISEDSRFENLGEAWLSEDHYKWRAMRANGVDEFFITGGASSREKFQKWAETIPFVLRNPLYLWSHLELQRYFNVRQLLSPDTASVIYEKCSEMLTEKNFSQRALLRRMNVKALSTTDDPIDSLVHHKKLRKEKFDIEVRPTFRPDRAMNLKNLSSWREYIELLEESAGIPITDMDSLLQALENRHAFFHSQGCRLADHGVERITPVEIKLSTGNATIRKALKGQEIVCQERKAFEALFLYELGKMHHAKGWVQQIHVGAFRNTNGRLFQALGPDAGFDSIGDYRQGAGLAHLLDRLNQTGQLAKTILYNINPSDNALIATLVGNFQEAPEPGRIQWGPAWWFLDQREGIARHLNDLSLFGVLGRFVGMVTDSRTPLSFPRHEYFRRVLCNLIGEDVKRGELPHDEKLLGSLVENICYRNACSYFGEGQQIEKQEAGGESLFKGQ